MKVLVLAAGYATRLYPLTENFPKPLLDVGGKAIIDWVLDDINADGYILVSNHRFAAHFQWWAATKPYEVIILDDRTSTNDTRLGAVRDIQFAVGTLSLNDDLLVMAGDNLLDFSLNPFIDYAKSKGTSCVMRYSEHSLDKLKKCGVLAVDDNDLVLSMEEKPQQPKSSWLCPPFYYLKKDDVALLQEAIESGCGTDAPGSFIAWLCRKSPVHAMLMPGKRYDVGNLDSYIRIKSEFKGCLKKM